MPNVAGIKKCDPFPACLPNTQMAGGRAARDRRFPLEQADTRVADGGCNVPTAIAGTIVDADQFVGGKALGQNAVDRSGYMRRLVVERHDDRKAGTRHIDPLLPTPEPPRDTGTTANIQATQPLKVPPSTADQKSTSMKSSHSRQSRMTDS